MRKIEQIGRDHPELIKYLDELSEGMPNEQTPLVNIDALKDFYESLLTIERSGVQKAKAI